MRLWSVHPRFFDRQALTACWREGLLAQAVIGKSSGGYSNHPQLVRFRACPEPLVALGAFLGAIVDEADARGYTFARAKILHDPSAGGATQPREDWRIALTDGQLAYEWQHLRAKLAVRTPERLVSLDAQPGPVPHPIFRVVPGPVEPWERPSGPPAAASR